MSKLSINGIEPLMLGEQAVWTIKQFSELVDKSVSSIQRFFIYGNKKRKLKKINIDNKPFIPYEELFEFPFVQKGRPDSLGMYTAYTFVLEEGVLVKDFHQEYENNDEGEDLEEEEKEDYSNDIIDDDGTRENDVFEEPDEIWEEDQE